MLDESASDVRVGCVAHAVREHYVIDIRQSRHQLRPGPLGEQRPRRVRDLDHKQLPRRFRFVQHARMLGQQRIEVPGEPRRFRGRLFPMDNLGSCIH